MQENNLPSLKDLPKEDKSFILDNIDAIYTYLDMSIDSMTEEELIAWRSILEEFDLNFEKD